MNNKSMSIEEYYKHKEEMNAVAQYLKGAMLRWSTIILTEARYKSNGSFIAVTVNFEPDSLLEVCYPGQGSYYLCPKWFTDFDVKYGKAIVNLTGLKWILTFWNKLIYKRAYKSALKKWPQYRNEIVKGAMYTKLVKS